jgi:hypothetical protein
MLPRPPWLQKHLQRNKLRSRLRLTVSPSSKHEEQKRKERELKPEPSEKLQGELAERVAKVARDDKDVARRERGYKLIQLPESHKSIAHRPSTPSNSKICLNQTHNKIKTKSQSLLSPQSRFRISPP